MSTQTFTCFVPELLDTKMVGIDTVSPRYGPGVVTGPWDWISVPHQLC